MGGHRYLGQMVTRSDRRLFERAVNTARLFVEQLGEAAQPDLRTHEGADPDGIGAKIFLRDYLRGMGFQPRIVIEPMVTSVMPLVREFELEATNEQPSTGMHFIVDTSARPLLNGSIDVLAPERTTIIDHHIPDETTINARFVIRNIRAVSTCEMLASLVPADMITARGAFALAVGIASDSERLAIAEHGTLTIFNRLLQLANVPREMIDRLADPSLDARTVVAVLADMKSVNSQVYTKGGIDWVISVGVSRLTPFILANALRSLDAHISAAISKIGPERYKASFRIGFNVAMEAGIHANDIAERASKLCMMPKDMWGGGQIDKAGAILHGKPGQILRNIEKAIRDTIDAATTVF